VLHTWGSALTHHPHIQHDRARRRVLARRQQVGLAPAALLTSASIEAAAALAYIICEEAEFWVDATEAAEQGWPLYGPDQELATSNARC
jgi:hypothetical protein